MKRILPFLVVLLCITASFGQILPKQSFADTTICHQDGFRFGPQVDVNESSVYLDGINDYIETDTSSALNFSDGSFTISAWANAQSISGRRDIVSKKSSEYAIYGTYNIRLEDGKPTFTVRNQISAPWYVEVQSATAVATNEWHQYTGIGDTSTQEIRFYVDGILVGSTPWDGNLYQQEIAPLTVGAQFKGDNGGSSHIGFFKGYIDNIFVIRKALSDDEIGASSYSSPSKVTEDSQICGYWRIDETSGNEILDFGPNKINGELLDGAARNSDVPFGGEPFSYNWFNGSTDPELTIFPFTTREYWVEVTDAQGHSFRDSIEVGTAPAYDASITFDGAALTANVQGVNYQWYDCDTEEPITAATDKTFYPSFNGGYFAMISANGCVIPSNCIHVTSLPQTMPVNSLNDTTVCTGDQLTITTNPDINISSVYFNGIHAKLESEPDSNFNFENESFTVSCWVKVDDISGRRDILSKKSSEFGLYPAWGLRLEDGIPHFTVRHTEQYPFYTHLIADDTISTGTWHYFVAVGDTSTKELRLYKDALLIGTQNWNGNIFQQEVESLMVGAHFKADAVGNCLGHFKGNVDDIAIWNGVLTPTEIRTNMLFRQYAIQSNNLVAYWPLDENDSTVGQQIDLEKTGLNFVKDPAWDTEVGFGAGPYNYSWSNGETTKSIQINPEDSTEYSVIASDNQGNTYYDTIRIFVRGDYDESISWNGTQLSASLNNGDYQWINCSNNQEIEGDTSQTFVPQFNGTYAAYVGQEGCKQLSNCITVNTVANAMPHRFLNDTTTCNSDSITFTTRPNINSSSLFFNGINQHAEVEAHTDFNFYGGNFTVSAWAHANDTTGRQDIFSKKASENAQFGSWGIRLEGGTPVLTLAYSANYPWYLSVIPEDFKVSPGTWYHYTAVGDSVNQKVKLYIDGALVAEEDWNGQIYQQFDEKLVIGAHFKADVAGSYTGYFDGNIDELGIWNSALSEESINRNKLFRTEAIAHKNAIAYWNMDGDSTVLEDVSGNDLSGTIINNPMWHPAVPFGGIPYNYSWDHGATSQAIKVKPQHNAYYSVTVTDAQGNFYYDDFKVYIGQGFETTIEATKDGLTLVADQDGATYQWIDCETNEIVPGAKEQVFTPAANGTYAAEIGFNGCLVTSECITLDELPEMCPAGKMDDTTVCQGDTVFFTPITDINLSSLSFDGEQDYLLSAIDSTFNFISGGFTFGIWAKADSVEGRHDLFSKKSSENAAFGSWGIQIIDSIPTFTLRFSCCTPWYVQAASQFPVGANEWHYYVAVADSANQVIKLYVDGQLVASEEWNGVTYQETPAALTIGAHFRADQPSLYTHYFDGELDDAGFWKKALTKPEIQQNMHCRTRIYEHPNLIAYWPMDENSGNESKDSTGNGFNLAFGQTPTWSNNVGFGAGPFTYLWSDGSTNQTLEVSPDEPTNYWVEVKDAHGHVYYDTAKVQHFLYGDTITIDSITLSTETSNASFQWYDCHTGLALDGETGPSLITPATGSYYLKVYADQCTTTSKCYTIVHPEVCQSPYVAYATKRRVLIDDNSTVNSGSLGATGHYQGELYRPGKVILNENVDADNIESWILADELEIDESTQTMHVYSGIIDNYGGTVNGAIHGYQPELEWLPEFPDSTSPGVADTLVGIGLTLTLPAGSYRNIAVDKNASLLLNGVYYMNNLSLFRNATLAFTGPTTIYIEANLEVHDFAEMWGSYGHDAADLVVYAKQDIKFGRATVISGNYYSKLDISLNDGSSFEGVMIGRGVKIGEDVTLDLLSACWNSPSGFRAPNLAENLGRFADGNNLPSLDVRVFPNPFQETANMSITSDMDCNSAKVELFDSQGKRVSTCYNGPIKKDQNYSITIDAKGLNNGLYFARFSSEHSIEIVKLVVGK